jgi:hypothetical protein
MPERKHIDTDDTERLGIEEIAEAITTALAKQTWKDPSVEKAVISKAGYISHVEKVFNDNTTGTACFTCPRFGRCMFFKWKKLLDKSDKPTWLYGTMKVSGCSYHPDQKKFKGKSVTMTFVDLTRSGYLYAYGGGVYLLVNMDPNADFTDGPPGMYFSCGNDLNGAMYEIRRGCLLIDASAILDDSTILNGNLILWGFQKNNADGGLPTVEFCNGMPFNRPADPFGLSDYWKNFYETTAPGGSIAYNAITVGAWNTIPLNAIGVSMISNTNLTRFCMRHSRDLFMTVPSGIWNVIHFEGPANPGGHDPRLEVTLELPQPNAGALPGL